LMPWRECSVMEERLRFVARLLDGESLSDVCREFGISRKTGYKIFNGRSNVSQSQQSVMPAFGYVEDVLYNLNDIYSYLKPRADGAIGRGRPQRLPKAE
jgi:Homeodomain-like domain